jgi:hypothetical protein
MSDRAWANSSSSTAERSLVYSRKAPGAEIGIVCRRSFIPCGDRAIVDFLDLISLEGSGWKRIVQRSKGFHRQHFSMGLTTRLQFSYEQTACECSKTRKILQSNGQKHPTKTSRRAQPGQGVLRTTCGRGSL